MTKFVPIFEKEGNKFFVLTEEFVAEDSWEAMKIGWGASLVEAVLWEANFTNETIDVTNGILHLKAHIDRTPIAIIGGSLFDEIENEQSSG